MIPIKKSVTFLFWQKKTFLANSSLFTVLSGMFYFGKNDVNCICIVKYHLNLRFFFTHHERSLLVSCCGNIMLFLGQFWSLYGTFICFFCKNYVNCICIVKYHLNLRFLIPIMKEVCEFPDLAKNCLIWPISVTFRYLTALFWLKNCRYFLEC